LQILEQLSLDQNIQPTETNPICTNSNCAKQAASSNDDILSQDIEEVVVMKQTKKIQPSKKNSERRG
jgi:hypothetical protein